jgi:glycosyltransferase involved in cell wall biosynthesis
MINQDVKLSIIIPTKNRYNCLIPVVESILTNINRLDFEIVIQDNSDFNEEVISFIDKNKKDSRIKYFYTKHSIPISENTIKAIDNSSGKYLCFIGDDDMVCSDICDIVDDLESKNIECLIYNAGYYWWDSVKFEKKDHYHDNKNLWLPKNKSKDLIKLNSNIELEKTLKKGAVQYYSLPRFYHGIVRKNVLDKIKLKVGTYLPASCPDMSFAVSISLVIDDYYYMNYPVSIFGASKNSGGGMTAEKKHYGKIEDMEFLKKDILNYWPEFIPKIWSQKTIYPQTTYEVLTKFSIQKKINFISFFASMLANEPYLWRFLVNPIFSYCKFNILKYFILFFEILKKYFGILLKKKKTYFKELNFDVIKNVNPSEMIKIN